MQATKSKIGSLAPNSLLGPSKWQNRTICRDPIPTDTPSNSDTELALTLADDSTEDDEKQDADCVFGTDRIS
jgi:hypothetical protein